MNRSLSVRAIILHNDRLLCVRLKAYNQAVRSDHWCLPGGGVDPGEPVLPALQREIQEETGVTPQIGKLMYIHQFKSGHKDILELFFHVTNAQDFLNIDLTKTSHGHQEIAEIDFVDPASTRILPEFLTTVDLSQKSSSGSDVEIYSFT